MSALQNEIQALVERRVGAVAATVRGLAPDRISLTRLFGGPCWMVSGNMAFGVHKTDGLCVRVGPTAAQEVAKRKAEAKMMTLTGRVLSNYVTLKKVTAGNVDYWMKLGLEHAAGLPRKPGKGGKAAAAKPATAKKAVTKSAATAKKKTAAKKAVADKPWKAAAKKAAGKKVKAGSK